MQQVGGGQGIIERPVRRLVGEAQHPGEGAQLAVGHVAAHQTTCQRQRVDASVGQRLTTGGGQCGVEEAAVEAQVVADEHRVAKELQERRQHRLDARRPHDVGVGDAGEHGDVGRDGPTRVDQRLERPQAGAASHLDRPHLGDQVDTGTSTGGLQVDDAEGDVGEWRTQIVERPLNRGRWRASHRGHHRRTQVRRTAVHSIGIMDPVRPSGASATGCAGR